MASAQRAATGQLERQKSAPVGAQGSCWAWGRAPREGRHTHSSTSQWQARSARPLENSKDKKAPQLGRKVLVGLGAVRPARGATLTRQLPSGKRATRGHWKTRKTKKRPSWSVRFLLGLRPCAPARGARSLVNFPVASAQRAATGKLERQKSAPVGAQGIVGPGAVRPARGATLTRQLPSGKRAARGHWKTRKTKKRPSWGARYCWAGGRAPREGRHTTRQLPSGKRAARGLWKTRKTKQRPSWGARFLLGRGPRAARLPPATFCRTAGARCFTLSSVAPQVLVVSTLHSLTCRLPSVVRPQWPGVVVDPFIFCSPSFTIQIPLWTSLK